MAKPQFKHRTVLEPSAEFHPSETPPPLSSSLSSLSISSTDSQTLIHIGTSDGKLILLSSNPSASDQSNSVQSIDLLRSVSITSRPVDSIILFADSGRILALSDGSLFLLDFQLLHPVRRLNFPKGVSAVASRPRCADSASLDRAGDGGSVSAGQRILQKLGGGMKANGARSRVLEENCVVAVAIGKKLLLVELDVEAGGVFVVLKEIQGVDGVMNMVWIKDSIIVGTADGYVVFSSSSGNGSLIFSLPESSRMPLLKSLWRQEQALLLVDNVGIVVNDLGQPAGGSLVFQQVPDSVGEVASYVVVVTEGKMDLYQKKTGVCVQSISFAVGGDFCVVADEENGNGEVVVVATPSKVICFRKVSAEEQIKDLLRKKNFKDAISLVEELECEGEMTKEMLSFVHAQVGFLLLFDLHFEDAVNHFLQSESMQPSEIFPFIMRDPNRWSHLVPRNRYWGLHPPPVPFEDVVDDGLMAIQRAIVLRKAGVDTVADEDFLLNTPSRSDLLDSAIRNIIRYMRVSRDKDLNPLVKEGVDTLLLYLYRALNWVDEMEQLASSPNSCVVEELETLLDDSGHLRTLAFLYASKGMCLKALAIWHILARNYSTGLWKDPNVESFSHDSCKNIISGQEIAAIEASKLLEESSEQDMVLQHLGWIADVDQELAVKVLTSEKRTSQLSPEEVLSAIDPKKAGIQQRYLQWLIEDQDSDDTKFHTLYALSLAKSALETVELELVYQNTDAKRPTETNASDVESGTLCSNSMRERLQLFLQSSDLYDPEEVLYVIEGSELWLEKAILYRKLGQETLVLQILALKLEDSEAAEQYCAEIGRHDAYMQLLDMYLDPQDGKEPMFKAAVRLLHKHGESLDPLQVLETLSPDMPLQLASDTILRMLRARVHHHRQGQIVHYLSRAINLDAKLARLEERSRHVQINDESLCDSCHARLGTKLFAMYPDDSVVCYKCFRRRGESTSVTGQDFKKEIIFKPGWLVSK
eukprot:TRINITY_DN4002_c0_g1_i2.p1 TRINITY_DN4002_c0_g1~~TRINITY_DN4002_c0_g1_i2.p1  ORF type:complete len:984 (-),score=196.53 TRINITY_DN4002_c0_g1_i2:466-3417(-)